MFLDIFADNQLCALVSADSACWGGRLGVGVGDMGWG